MIISYPKNKYLKNIDCKKYLCILGVTWFSMMTLQMMVVLSTQMTKLRVCDKCLGEAADKLV